MITSSSSFRRWSLCATAGLLALGFWPATAAETVADDSRSNAFSFSQSSSGQLEDFAKGETPEEMQQRFHQEMLQLFDKNHDGKLDAQELATARKWLAARKAAFIKKFDTNHDGKLDAAELAAAKESIAKARLAFMKKFDKNGDGKLDAVEAAAMRKELAARRKKFLEYGDDSKLEH